MSTDAETQGKAVYAVTESDRLWLLSEQRKLYARSMNEPDYVWGKLWGLVTDLRNLRLALARVARNRGRNTPGVDRVTVRVILDRGVDTFLGKLREELREKGYRPRPVRRVLIPKSGQPGKFRPLGIPTVKDRVVQAALKNILEPIFEADFYPVSYGFRPGKSAHGALEHLRLLLRPHKVGLGPERRLPYQWAIEGDIKGCFDHIDHHALMERVRRRVADAKVGRLVLAFLKSGALSENQFLRSDAGTPQGGILSPLLANIALSAIEERYERHVWPRLTPTLRTEAAEIEKRAIGMRTRDRKRMPIVFPIRYADDFVLLVAAPPGPSQEVQAEEMARAEKAAIASMLKERLDLELSESKTLVTTVTRPLRFLGHHVRVRPHPTGGRLVSTSVIPKDKSQRLREEIKRLFQRGTLRYSLENRLRNLNGKLRGWCNFYKHAWGAKHVFSSIDHYVWATLLRWVRKKHKHAPMRSLVARYGWWKPGTRGMRWRGGNTTAFESASVRVQPFRLAWQRPPAFASTPMESPVHNERCTPGLDGDPRKPAGESQ